MKKTHLNFHIDVDSFIPATDKEKEKTAYVLVNKYIKNQNPKNKIFVLHRLDKDTSGVLVFCKDEKIKNELQDKWNDIV